MQTRLMLVDDNYLVRDGLQSIFSRESRMRIVAVADNGRDAVRKAEKSKPDVVFMDVSLGEMNGADVTREIVARVPQVKVIALSIHLSGVVVRDMFRAGASGYVWKDDAVPQVLVDAVMSVCAGNKFLSRSVADVVVTNFLNPDGDDGNADAVTLTQREVEVLKYLAEGCMNKQIAERLLIAVRTVERHRHVIMRKLNLHSQAELTKYAVRSGLTQL